MKSLNSSKKTSLILLFFMTILMRYPSTPSPTGTDNFYYISVAKAILYNGQIFWADNILTFYGLFPGTSPLGATLFASVVCSLTGLSIYQYIFIHGFIFSTISTYGFFMLTGEFTNNYRSRWFATLCFSLAPRFLTFSIWRLSLRYSLISILPFFIWLLLRLQHHKYGRYPLRIISLLFITILILPSLHRMGLLFPGILIAFILSNILYYWQESATNRERAGRQALFFLLFLSSYLFYLQYLDFSPYSPDDEVLGAYLFSGYGIFSSMGNLALYYLLNVGPFIFVSVIGIVFWVQEGRVSHSYFFSMSYLALGLFVISDLIYIPYLWSFGILLFIAPGMDFFAENLEANPDRQSLLFAFFVLLILSFTHYDLNYRLESHNRDEVYYSYSVRDSSFSTSVWIKNNLETSIMECNDAKRDRRIAAYSNFIPIGDAEMLSSGLIDHEKMQVERISIKDFYWTATNHLWEWSNQDNQTRGISENLSVSIVNLAIPDMRGKSSTLSLSFNSYYENMPLFNYALYLNKELALYWTSDY